jgi:hypothetical protein
MNWLKHKLRDWLNSEDSDRLYKSRGRNIAEPMSVSSDNIDADGYTLRVYPARGGRVIQYHKYDRKQDRANTSLYVISDSEDLGDAVKNIVVEQALQGN